MSNEKTNAKPVEKKDTSPKKPVTPRKPKVEIAVADMVSNEEQFRDNDDNIRKLSGGYFAKTIEGKKLFVAYLKAKATERKDTNISKVEIRFKKIMEKLDKKLERLNAVTDPKAKIALQIAKLQAKLAEAK